MQNKKPQSDRLVVPDDLQKGAACTKKWDSKELFSGSRELVIEHTGDEYRLRITNQGKLILTK
jgi:hemin uptake protein HemP